MSKPLDWLRDRSDEQLSALLRARPDLVVPAPDSLSVLARRLDSPPSVWRVFEELNQFQVQVLQAVRAVADEGRPVTATAIHELFGADVPTAELTRVLTELEDLGVLRSAGDGRLIGSPALGSALGEFPGGLGPSCELTPEQIKTALDELDPQQYGVLERLAQGQPRGTVAGSGPTAEAAQTLVAAGLLVQPRGPRSVVLPREVLAVLRGGSPFGRVRTRPPPAPPVEPGPVAVDTTAAGQAVTAVALAQALVTELGDRPAAALKSGGIGVRELRRLARALDRPDGVAALLLEILAAAGVIAPTPLHAGGAWTPTTTTADDFLGQDPEPAWCTLAATWLNLRRDPSRVGTRDVVDKVINALTPETAWIRGPMDRRFALGLLAGLPPGTRLAGQDRIDRLTWYAPLRLTPRGQELTTSVLAEATTLGLVAFDALSEAGRMILRGDPAAAAGALAAALPEPVDRVVVQADLTVIAPGRLDNVLAGRLAQVADVESAGSATVYRITAASLRRAFDLGSTAAELHELFASHSATAVPQALTYLIDDLARRHGLLRAGSAGCYLRSDDPAIIDAALKVNTAEPGGARTGTGAGSAALVRRLAPTVAVSRLPVEELLPLLRRIGLDPAAEDDRGRVVGLAASPQRTKPAPVPGSLHRELQVPSDQQLQELVRRMRAVDSGVAAAGQSPGEVAELLRTAAREGRPVSVAHVEADGSLTRRVLIPIALSGGSVAAYDRLLGTTRTFALHRIAQVLSDGNLSDGPGPG